MTTFPSSLQWLKPPGYRYEPGPLTPAQQTNRDRYERARLSPATQPQNVNPQQASQALGAQGKGLVNTALDAGQTAGQIGIENRRGLNEVDGQAYSQKKGADAGFYRDVVGTSVDGNLRLQDANFDRGLQVAREIRGMGGDMGAQVAGAIAGEQALKGRELEILREALQPSLVDNISGIAGAITPLILAAFAA